MVVLCELFGELLLCFYPYTFWCLVILLQVIRPSVFPKRVLSDIPNSRLLVVSSIGGFLFEGRGFPTMPFCY